MPFPELDLVVHATHEAGVKVSGASADRQLAVYKRGGDMKAVVDQLIAETAEGVTGAGLSLRKV